MDFYDLHLHSEFSEGKSSVEDFARRAKILGYKGICFAVYYKDKNRVDGLRKKGSFEISALLVNKVKGSHQTLIELLKKEFSQDKIVIDGEPVGKKLNPKNAFFRFTLY